MPLVTSTMDNRMTVSGMLSVMGSGLQLLTGWYPPSCCRVKDTGVYLDDCPCPFLLPDGLCLLSVLLLYSAPIQ